VAHALDLAERRPARRLQRALVILSDALPQVDERTLTAWAHTDAVFFPALGALALAGAALAWSVRRMGAGRAGRPTLPPDDRGRPASPRHPPAPCRHDRSPPPWPRSPRCRWPRRTPAPQTPAAAAAAPAPIVLRAARLFDGTGAAPVRNAWWSCRGTASWPPARPTACRPPAARASSTSATPR
jgi:hypothetical protein